MGISSASPSRSTRPRPPTSRMATSSAATPSGTLGPAACTKNGRPSASTQVDAGDVREQAVDGAHAELVGGELDDQSHDRVGARGRRCLPRAARAGSCWRSRIGGGHRPAPRARSPRRRRWPARDRGRRSARASGGRPSLVDRGGVGLGVAGRAARTGRRGGTGPRSGRGWQGGAQQLEAVGLGLGERAFVGHHAAAVVVERQAPSTPVVRWAMPSSPVKSMR